MKVFFVLTNSETFFKITVLEVIDSSLNDIENGLVLAILMRNILNYYMNIYDCMSCKCQYVMKVFFVLTNPETFFKIVPVLQIDFCPLNIQNN